MNFSEKSDGIAFSQTAYTAEIRERQGLFENFNFLKNYFFCTFNAVEFESIVLVCKLFYAVNVNEPYTAYFGDIFVNVGRYGKVNKQP